MRILLIIIYVALTSAGLILMKKGGNAGKITVGSQEFGFTMSWISALGFVCYIMSFLLFTRIIMMFDNVSYISPICNGIAQMCILAASIIFLKEQFSMYTIGGAACIIVGVIIMNIKK